MTYLVVRSSESFLENIYFKVIKESAKIYTTNECFSLNIVGLTAVERRNKIIKWSKDSNVRMHEGSNAPSRIIKIIDSLPEDFKGILV